MKNKIYYFYITPCIYCEKINNYIADGLLDVTPIDLAYYINDKLAKKYDVNAAPTFVIIDDAGKLIKKIDDEFDKDLENIKKILGL